MLFIVFPSPAQVVIALLGVNKVMLFIVFLPHAQMVIAALGVAKVMLFIVFVLPRLSQTQSESLHFGIAQAKP